MRAYSIILLTCLRITLLSQISQIVTGTSESLYDLSIIADKLVVSGTQTYMASSNDEFKHFNLISKPLSTSAYNVLQRLDTNNLFLFSYNANQTLIYHSNDCGAKWIEKYNSIGGVKCVFSFHDTLNGYRTSGSAVYRTNNGGPSFSQIYPPYQTLVMVTKTFKDSLIALAGVSGGSSGVVLSKNRGNSWSLEWPLWNVPTDIFFLNKDTIVAISDVGGFISTFNGGNSWNNNSPYITLKNSTKIFFKNAKEGYAVGNDIQNKGTIAKTVDFGQTWTNYNTGINTTLYNIAFLNDSIAFLSGSNGVLLRWNYKQTIFTGVDNFQMTDYKQQIYPNPVNDKLKVEFQKNTQANVFISNMLGEIVLREDNFDTSQTLDVKALKPGVYFLKLQNNKGQVCQKFIKD